jgi:hypothetical protein
MKKAGGLILCFSLLINLCIMADDYIPNPLIIEADISLFEIGTDVSFLNLDNNRDKILINASTILPCFIVHSGDFSFIIAFKNNIIAAIFVGKPLNLKPDELFKTPEGIFLGMNYQDFHKLFPKIKLIEIWGWAYEAILPSGWKIGFSTGRGATDYFPKPEDKITMIYKN